MKSKLIFIVIPVLILLTSFNTLALIYEKDKNLNVLNSNLKIMDPDIGLLDLNTKENNDIGQIISNKYQNIDSLNNNAWNLDIIDSDGNVGKGSSIAIDSDGFPHISYFDSTNKKLKYATWTGIDWNISIIDSGVTAQNDIALDSNDKPFIAFMDRSAVSSSNFVLKIAELTGSGWKKTIVDPNHNSGWEVRLECDLNDIPHLIYGVNDDYYYTNYDGGNTKHAWKENNEWKTEIIETFCYCDHDLVIDSENNIHVVFCKLIPQSYFACEKIKYAKKVNSNWQIFDIKSIDQGFFPDTSLKIDNQDNLHLSFSERYGEASGGLCPYRVKYGKYNNGEWEITIIHEEEGKSAFYQDLAIDSNCIPYFCYSVEAFPDSDDFFILEFAKLVQNDLIKETIASSEENLNYGGHIAIEVDQNCNPHISLYYCGNIMKTCGLMYVYKQRPLNNIPFKPDIPIGSNEGKINKNYFFKTKTTDPDNHKLFYKFSWGDGTFSDWLGPYESGVICEKNNSWQEKGNFMIKVKARDIHHLESEWSDPLSIEITKSKNIERYKGLFSYFAILENLMKFMFS